MRTIVSIFGQTYAERPLGVSGENEATALEFDARGVLVQHPAARFSIKIKRPDGELYIAAAGLSADADAVVRYTVAAADVSVPGLLEMEVQATIDNVVIKTSRYYWAVNEAIDTGWPLPPDPTWVEDVIEAAARSQDGAARAEDAAGRAEAALDGMSDDAERAEAAASRAEESRDVVEQIAAGFTDEEAQRQQNERVRIDSEAERVMLYDVIREEYERGGFDGNLLYATFGVDFDTGDLMMFVPEGYDGPAFAINEATSSLEVTVDGGDVPLPLGRMVPMPAGDFSAAADYPFLAIVYHEGDAYLARKPTRGNPPTDAGSWMRVTHVGEGTTVRIGQVLTGAPGTTASIVNAGTALEQVWDITIPRGQDGTGQGDMLKAVYDINGSGVVDDAERLGGVLPGAYALKTDVPADILRYNTAQTLTTAQQASVRAKIGVTDGGFDGDYLSLTNKPTIPSAAADIGAVPDTRKVAGKALSADVTLGKADVGLSNVDNTSDANKPVSTAVQAALSGKSDTGHTHGQYLTAENDPTVPAWAKAPSKPAYSAAEVGAVPVSGGTLSGTLIVADPGVATKATRNIYAGTSDMVAGSSALQTGALYAVYE